MKKLTMLNINDMSIDQKLGMLDAAYLSQSMTSEQKDYIFELIRRRELGAVWVQWHLGGAAPLVKKVREIADYPIHII